MRRVTVIILSVVAVGLISWDIVVAVTPERGDTISEIAKHAAQDWKGIPFAFAALAAHFFWPITVQRPPALYWALFSILLSLTMGTFIWQEQFSTLVRHSNLLAMGLGLVLGRLLWPQKKISPEKANK